MTIQPTVDHVRPSPLAAVPTGLPTPLDSCPAELFDGWMLHEAALRNGLKTLLFPGQALMAYQGDDPAAGVAFAHGVSNTTWLSSATLVQDKRMRRDLVAAAGIPVPQARSFSLKRGTPYAKAFADSIGYPVVVKPMIGESTVEAMPGISNEAELNRAIDYLRKVPTVRDTFTTSSYAFTQILTPRASSSTRTRGNYRYLVEKHITGQYVRLLMAEGRVLSAIYAPEGPWRLGPEVRDITCEVHSDLREFAADIWRASPGLAVLAADVVVDDYATPFNGQLPVLVDLSERPWMQVQHAASPHLVPELGQQLLEAVVDAQHLSLPQSPPSEHVDATFRWDGLSEVGKDVQAAEGAAAQMQLSLQITSSDPVAGVITGQVSGSSSVIALLNELVIAGDVLSAPAMAAETRPRHGKL